LAQANVIDGGVLDFVLTCGKNTFNMLVCVWVGGRALLSGGQSQPVFWSALDDACLG
jgi:hypothetical protein